MPAIKPLDPLGIESESDPLGIESQSDPLGIEQPSLARDILTANQSALELAGQANQMVNTGLAARDIMLDRPELEGPEFKNPEDIRKVPMRDTILGDRGKPVPFWNYDRSPEERRAQFVEGLTTSPISIPKLGIGPTWLEKAFAVANPATLPLAIATSPTEAAQMNRSAANAVSGLAEFAITPAGILTAPLAAGVLGKTVATLTKLGFSADMAKAAGEQAGSLVGEWDNLSQLERTDKLVGLGFTAALAASLAAHTAPEAARAIADRVESDGAVLARKLADEVKAANLPAPKSPEVQRRLGIRLTAEPFLQPGIPELADQALREAQSPIIRPDPAIEQLRRAVEPPQIVGAEPTRVAERIPGGGQAPYGKVSFMRGAEAPLPERTQAAISAETVAQETGVPVETVEKGIKIEAADHPEIAQSNPEVLPQIAKDELKLDKKVYDKEVAPTPIELTKSGEIGKRGNEQLRQIRNTEPIPTEQTASGGGGNSVGVERGGGRGGGIESGGGAQPAQAVPVQGGPRVASGGLPRMTHAEFIKAGGTEAGWDAYAAEQNRLSRERGFAKIVEDYNAGGVSGNDIANLLRANGVSVPEGIGKLLQHDDTVVSSTGVKARGASRAEAQRVFSFVSENITKPKPLNPGGSVSSLSPELQAKNAEAVAAQKKIAEELKKSLERSAPPAQPAEVKPSRVQVQNAGPQTFTVVERLKQTEAEKANGEQPVRIRNEKTGKEEVVLESDLKEVSATAAAKPKGQTRVALDKALRDAGLDPSVFPDKASKKSALDRMIAKIEEAQAKIRGSRSTLRMGVPAAILDTALESARLALKAGKTLQEAIEAAIKHIRYNVKGFDEVQARAVLERELVGQKKSDTGTAAKEESVADTVPAAKSGETLDDVYKIFEPKKEPSQFSLGGLKRKAVQVVESLSTGLSSKFRPLNKLAEDIAKAYGRGSNKNIAAIFEQLKGSQGKGEADVYRFDRDVSALVKGSEKDFNAYMFLRRSLDRLQQDAKDITGELASPTDNFKANRRQVAGYTIRSLTSKLALLESKLGKEKLDSFEKAAAKYQEWMDNALKLQVESGRMSPEVYKAIKSGNQFYAPFKVMKYLEETQRPEGTGRKIDTVAEFTKAMTGIEDANFKLGDMLGAARQSILISRILADKNRAMQNIAEQALLDSDHRFIQRVPNPGESPLGKQVVNVMEGGKTTYYAVDPAVAEAIQLFGENGGGVISKVLRASSVPFKAGATALNLPFQVSNLLADIPRQALVSKYGITSPTDLVRYPLDLVHSLYSSISGDVFGRDNKLFLDFLDSGAAGTTVQEYLTPNALKFQEPTAISKSKRLASSVLNIIPEFAAAIEQTSKIVGVKRAMRFEGVTSGKELAARIPEAVTEIRRFSGSPDFGRQGKWVEQARLNLLYMFLNARIQGSIADIGRLGGRDGAKTAATTWFRVGTAVGLPTAYLYYLNQLPEYKDDYDKRPQQEKDNYWLIPKDSYITTEDGEKLRDYWRIPKRESAKWIGNMTESALKFAQNRNADAFYNFGQKMLEDISPVNVQGNTAQERAESVAASLNPVLKAPMELATGRDLYRHRQLVPDTMKAASPEQQYTDRTPEAFKKLAEIMPDVAPEILRSPIMLENLTRNLTAGLLTQFLPRKPVEGRSKLENNPLLARFQAMPYTDQESFRLEMQKLERSAADEFLARHRKAMQLLNDNKGKDLRSIVSGAGLVGGKDDKLVRHLVDLYVAKENGATQQDRQVMALPVQQRAEYVAKLLSGMSSEEKAQKIRELARKRILTEGVAEQLPKELLK